MSYTDVYVTPQDLVAGVREIPYRAPTAAAARIWCRRQGIVPVRRPGGRKIAYLKADILRVFEPRRSGLKRAS